MDIIRYLELIFGAITSIGVLYALLSPHLRRFSRKRKITEIIKQEMEDNHEAVAAYIFRDKFDNFQEENITIGDVFECSIDLGNDNWEMLKKEISELFDPRVFVTIDRYYDNVASILALLETLKKMNLIDEDVKKNKLKDHISNRDFSLVFCVAIDIIIAFTGEYQKLIKKDKVKAFSPKNLKRKKLKKERIS